MALTVTPQLFYSGAWHAVPAMPDASVTKIERGYTDEGTIRPSKVNCRINNAADDYRPTNPTAAVYGVAGRNTPFAVTCQSSTRAVVEASGWKPDQSLGFNAAAGRGTRWVDLEAQGMLRRIGQWTEPLRSAMYRQINKFSTLTGFWPLDDGRDSTQLVNVTTGPDGTFSGVTLGDAESPGGGATSVKQTAAGLISGTFLSASTSAGWQVSLAFKLPAIPVSGTGQPFFQWYMANGNRWTLSANNASYTVDVITQDGVSLLSSVVGFGAGAEPNKWITMRMRSAQSGGNVDWQWAWYAEGAPTVWGTSGLYAGAVSAPVKWRAYGQPITDGAWYAYVYGVTGVADDLLSAGITASFNGFPGERAGSRFLRLMGENGLTATVVGNVNTTSPMGPQRPDTLINLITECAHTEDAQVFDRRDAIGVVFRTRNSRYGQTPALALTFGPDVQAPMVENLDDLGVTNNVALTNRDGGTAVAVRTTGPLSVLPPPDGVGEYKGGSDLKINVANEAAQLQNLTNWYLARGTVEGSRYPTVTVDLLASPALRTAACAVDVGDLIRVTGRDPDPIDLQVIGIGETIGTHRQQLTFTCIPGAVFQQVGLYNNTFTRYDSRATTLNAGYSPTATTLVLTFPTPSDAWSRTAANQPYDLLVAGERIRVPVGGMGVVTGTGPYTQTITGAVRSINGVVKAQLAGAAVHTADVARYAL
jgi:hypothetical protein